MEPLESGRLLPYSDPMRLEPVVAGHFYPGDPSELHRVIRGMSRTPVTPMEGPVEALLLPHAGYPYSGETAALGYRSIPSPPSLVVVVGPSHYVPFKGVSLFAGASVGTPLGDLPVDQEACRFLMGFDDHLAEIPAAFAREHSVEVHLPLVRTFWPGAKVVPVVMGQGEAGATAPLARALSALRGEREFLLVASSDLSHYPPRDIARKADLEFLEALLTGDEKRVNDADRDILRRGYPEYHCTHCGKEPVAVLLRHCRSIGARGIRLLDYRNSGDVTGEKGRAVGYAAVAFLKGDS